MGTRTVRLRTQSVDRSTHNETACINHHVVQYSLHCRNKNSLARAEVNGAGHSIHLQHGWRFLSMHRKRCTLCTGERSPAPSWTQFCPRAENHSHHQYYCSQHVGWADIFWSENVRCPTVIANHDVVHFLAVARPMMTCSLDQFPDCKLCLSLVRRHITAARDAEVWLWR